MRPILEIKPEIIKMIDEYNRIRRSDHERAELDKLPAIDRDGFEIQVGDTVEFVSPQRNRKAVQGKAYEVLSKRRYSTHHDGGEVAILCDDGKVRGYSTRKVRLINGKSKTEMSEFHAALEML